MGFARPATDPGFFGITRRHWDILVQTAGSRGYVLCIRCGKKAAVRWIERGFPAKPMSFKKCKVDPHVGLLLARTAEERTDAWNGGFPVLEPVAGRPGEFAARLAPGLEAFGGQRFARTRHEWAQEHLVIDPKLRLPVTSDYDLGAIVDTEQSDYGLTYGSWAGGSNRTNPIVAGLSAELNARFGTPRIMHGSEAQYSGSLAHSDDDAILIFHPTGEVEHMAGQTALATDLILRDIVLRYHPGMGHLYRQ